jgi:hypothetical protein
MVQRRLDRDLTAAVSRCTLLCRDCPVCECTCDDECTLDCHEITAANRPAAVTGGLR